MIFTARQLEDLHRNAGGNGHLVLPYGARLTPLGADWVRSRKIGLGYGPDELVKQANGDKPVNAVGAASSTFPATAGGYLWWCDGPCGAAKAAAVAVGKEASLAGVDEIADPKRLLAVIKRVAKDVRENSSVGAVLMVASGGAATVLANRSPLLRAVLGTTLESLESAVSAVAANVLVIEYPRKSFPEIKNLLSRFVRAKRSLSTELCRQMQELSSENCSPMPGKADCGCGCKGEA